MISDNKRAIHRLLELVKPFWEHTGEKFSGLDTQERTPGSLPCPLEPKESRKSPARSPSRPIACFRGPKRDLMRLGSGHLKACGRALRVFVVLFPSLAALPLFTQAAMVDTVQYGQIQVGMKEKEVLERLGPPDRIQEKEKSSIRKTSSKGSGRQVRSKKLIYRGTNPASGQRITTTIILENGKVVDKRRSYD